MNKKLSTTVVELSKEELQNIDGGVLFLIPPTVIAIAKGAALIAGSGIAGCAFGYGLYELFN